jgi:hypothetical protein
MEHGSARTAFLALIITTGLVRICGAQTPPIKRRARSAQRLPSGLRDVTESKIRVEYRRDPKLQLLVPTEMEEVFGFEMEVLHGEATYRNYRRFETGARMLTSPR